MLAFQEVKVGWTSVGNTWLASLKTGFEILFCSGGCNIQMDTHHCFSHVAWHILLALTCLMVLWCVQTVSVLSTPKQGRLASFLPGQSKQLRALHRTHAN